MITITRYIIISLLAKTGVASLEKVMYLERSAMPLVTGVVSASTDEEVRREFNIVGRELKRRCGNGVLFKRDAEIRVASIRCMEVVESMLKEFRSNEWRYRLPELVKLYVEAVDKLLGW